MAARGTISKHLILFDGGCGLCSRAINFVAQRDTAGIFGFESLLSDRAKGILESRSIRAIDPETSFVLANWNTPRESVLDRSTAAIFVLRRLGWPWAAFAALAWVPKPLRDQLYDQIARNRGKLSGGLPTCSLPETARKD